jgi:DNA end-binding protein Ku
VVILRPAQKGIVLHTMYYADEVRAGDAFRTDSSQVKEKELNLAKMLIETLQAEFEPQKYSDTYRENLKMMIEAKVAGQKIVETPQAHVAPVIDIMEALKKSLEQKKKPPQSATASSGEAEEAAEEPASKKRRTPQKRAGNA